MIWLVLRFCFFTLWLFPIYRGCQKRHPDDSPLGFVTLVILFTLAWVSGQPGTGLGFLLGWFTLPWLAWGLVKALRSRYRPHDG
ncbi:hypothetical protein [Gallaecimonas sp. GXIMD4217]|uniref:hypothetical protein n=1 Tax=Gallaecimonas sp. GXIMD4217 TaxID=3131927 RepID=UPI00311B3165